jgi:HTH-type transcriptional regulator, sugar sensing transcriptional regulator
MDAIIERFKQLGLNTYEAKVYLALLKNHPATGYEISKNSNVPQARAYDTLKALESQKMVVATDGKPVTYIPVSPEEILNRFEKQYKGSIDFLRTSLPSYAIESIEPVHNLRGVDAIYAHAREMIESAQQTVFMEIWSDDQGLLDKPLRDAAARGVSVHVVGYNTVTYDFCKVYQHQLADSIEASLGGRWLILAVDANEAMVGSAPVGSPEPHALWTKNPAIVLVIKELVVHDIFLLDVEKTLREPMEKAYGSHLLKLRNKILGNEILIGAH